MNLKTELQNLNNSLDKMRHKFEAAKERNDRSTMKQLELKMTKAAKKIGSMKEQLSKQLSGKQDSVNQLAFNRPLTKAEQADMGKFKKTVKGLVVVHPMTALGREMGVDKVTGFAPKEF